MHGDIYLHNTLVILDGPKDIFWCMQGIASAAFTG